MRRGRSYLFLAFALALLLAGTAVVGCGDSPGPKGEDTSPGGDTAPATNPSDAGNGKPQLLLFTQPG